MNDNSIPLALVAEKLYNTCIINQPKGTEQ